MRPDAICHALGNETRYGLIKAMKEKSIVSCCDRFEFYENGVSVGDVVKFTGLAQSTVSQHLSVLEKAGLIRKEKRDQWSCFFLNDEILKRFLSSLEEDLT